MAFRDLAVPALLALATIACGEGDKDKDTDVALPEDTASGGSVAPEKWRIEQVDGDDVGRDATLAVAPDGALSIAYFSNVALRDGECTEVVNNQKPTRMRYDLKLATRAADGAWSTEVIDAPLYPNQPGGVAHAYTRDGAPAVAYMGGEPELDWCGANDAFYAVKSGGAWVTETAARESGDAATGDEASDAGFSVGWNPAMAFDTSGEPFIVYQDQHFVYLQRDDTFRADAELAWRTGGSWSHEAVDFGEGAGDTNEIIFDSAGRPIVFYTITREARVESRHGVWAARRLEDGTWEQVKIHTGAIGYGISAAVDPAFDEPVVAFYSKPDRGVKVRRLIDPEAFTEGSSWASEIVKDTRYDEGNYISLAFSPGGDIALSYHRCRRYNPDEDNCDTNDEALVFARKKSGKWVFEVIHRGEDKSCGTYTSLAFSEDGAAHIAYQCTTRFMDDYALSLYIASKKF